MKKTLMTLALLGLFIAGCESTPRNEEPAVEESDRKHTTESSEETTEEPATDGQLTKEVIYILGVNGMD